MFEWEGQTRLTRKIGIFGEIRENSTFEISMFEIPTTLSYFRLYIFLSLFFFFIHLIIYLYNIYLFHLILFILLIP